MVYCVKYQDQNGTLLQTSCTSCVRKKRQTVHLNAQSCKERKLDSAIGRSLEQQQIQYHDVLLDLLLKL